MSGYVSGTGFFMRGFYFVLCIKSLINDIIRGYH